MFTAGDLHRLGLFLQAADTHIAGAVNNKVNKNQQASVAFLRRSVRDERSKDTNM